MQHTAWSDPTLLDTGYQLSYSNFLKTMVNRTRMKNWRNRASWMRENVYTVSHTILHHLHAFRKFTNFSSVANAKVIDFHAKQQDVKFLLEGLHSFLLDMKLKRWLLVQLDLGVWLFSIRFSRLFHVVFVSSRFVSEMPFYRL